MYIGVWIREVFQTFPDVVCGTPHNYGGALVCFVDNQIVIGGELIHCQFLSSGEIVFLCGVWCEVMLHCQECILEYFGAQLLGMVTTRVLVFCRSTVQH